MKLAELYKINLRWCETTELHLFITADDSSYATYTMEQALELYGEYTVYGFIDDEIMLGGDPT